MSRAFIFANGRMGKLTEIASIIQESDLIIAADGGIHNCKTIGIIPNVIIGDLDSMSSDEVTTYQEAGAEVIQFPTHKDETDLELALQYALKHELSEVIIIGALGARWDMTIANILLIANPRIFQPENAPIGWHSGIGFAAGWRKNGTTSQFRRNNFSHSIGWRRPRDNHEWFGIFIK